jgi:DNA modification methylase
VSIGHVLDCLRERADQSVQMIATSPPYFGLRDYGLPPVIWEPVVYAPMPGLPPMPFPAHADPDAFQTCAHDWGEWLDHRDVREEVVQGKTRTTDRFYGDDARRRFDGNHQKHAHGQFCTQCGAWRGCLGLEPDPHLYTGHLVQVFREARRVLADDGVLWLNLGDSYNASGRSGHGTRQGVKQGTNRASHAGADHCRPNVAGLKPKDLIAIPWRAALALQADGWYLRSDVVWAKGLSFAQTWHGNPMPESVKDRPTRAHEMVFLLSKRERYFFDHVAVKEAAVQSATDKAASLRRDDGGKRAQGIPGQPVGTHRESRPDVSYNTPLRNLRDVWAVITKPYPGAHFAVWPEELVRPMVLAGTSAQGHCPACGARWRRTVNATTGFQPQCHCGIPPVPDVVLDLFGGSGTTAAVALSEGRDAWLIEANPAYTGLQQDRMAQTRQKGQKGRRRSSPRVKPAKTVDRQPGLFPGIFEEVAA